MIPNYRNVHLKFELNNCHYNQVDLKEVAYSYVKEGEPYQMVLGDFLLDWLDHNDYITVKTSGSTGNPKYLKIKKQAMVHSAIATGDYFNLKPGHTALQCLPLNFIAGKMMLVRAIILGLKLDVVEPSSKPLQDLYKKYDFCAMTPFQVENTIDDIDKIRILIIGGGQVTSSLRDKLQEKTVKAYETYGMTETITHIAIKKINTFDDVTSSGVERSLFKVLPNVSITQDARDCLVIEAFNITTEKIVTNDIVKLHSQTTFEWLGRYDNVINSGGIKLFPEQIEQKLSEVIKERFFVTAIPHDRLGEQLVLIVESSNIDADQVSNAIKNLKTLDNYETPKQVFLLQKFIETQTGKIQRAKTLELLKV